MSGPYQLKLTINIYKLMPLGEYGINLHVDDKFAGAADISDIKDVHIAIEGILKDFVENRIKVK